MGGFSRDVRRVTGGSPVQVQRGRAAAEGAAGGSHLAHQTGRLSEEEPGGSAAAARQVIRKINERSCRFICCCASASTGQAAPASASLSRRMASVLGEREEEIGSLQSDLRRKDGDITGRCDISAARSLKTKVLELLGFIQSVGPIVGSLNY